MQVILHAAHRGSNSFEMQTASWEYDVRLTYPKSDRALHKALRGTGLSKRAASAAILNSAAIAERCSVTLPKAPRLRYPRPGFYPDAMSYLQDLVDAGWIYRGLDRMKPGKQWRYRDRIKREMKLIKDKDFADFFLATADVVAWAKNAGIAVGPARGSAAASLVCYLLRITEVDPMRYPMMMLERFIDPSRPDAPDIDLDFSDERRDEIRGYLAQKYGEENVGNIGNFVRYRGKNSINDVGRVYRIPVADTARMNDLVAHRSDGDMRVAMSVQDTIDSYPVAREIVDRWPQLMLATRLEGDMRGMSVHAAGLVVSTSPIPDVTALYTRKSGTGQMSRMLRVLAVDKYDAEYLGMLKMDFLGLTTMGMISHALDLAGLTLEELYGVGDDDKKVMKAFRRNDVTGIFQFEGRATRLVNREVKPSRFMDLASINALSRPGPLFSGTASEYVKIRRGLAEIESLHPALDEITKDTYGQIIFQEQIIAIVRQIGGFDWTDANSVRRIIAKKLGEAAFNVNFKQFAEGADRIHGIDGDLAMRIWKRLVTAGTYAFNIAHSVSYSLLAWWCMWLKVYYPVEFYTASLIKADSDDVVRRLLTDARRHGVRYSPPDPLGSGVTWDIREDADGRYIQAGFMQIPGIGFATATEIVSTRASDPFRYDRWLEDNWPVLLDVKGIGPVTLKKIIRWADRDDPFRVDLAAETIAEIRRMVEEGELPGVPMPTHDSASLQEVSWISGAEHNRSHGARSGRGRRVVWAGLIVQRDYKDLIEDQRARTGEEVEEIRRRIKDPRFVKFCTLRCRDTGDDDVYLRINRYKFPKLRVQVDEIVPGRDAVVAIGRETLGFGAAIQVDQLWVISPEDDEEPFAQEEGDGDEPEQERE